MIIKKSGNKPVDHRICIQCHSTFDIFVIYFLVEYINTIFYSSMREMDKTHNDVFYTSDLVSICVICLNFYLLNLDMNQDHLVSIR
jgi:hypothetical protein